MTTHRHQPVHRPFFTSGTLFAMALMAIAAAFALARFAFGLGAVTNLSDPYPWGIWIAVDVASGVALAAGGFTTATLVYILHRDTFHQILRPALLTAWLGYLFVSIGLLADLGRYYNIWHPMIHWQGNSVLFEVGICVMTYLTVLTIEFLPILIEGIQHHTSKNSPLARWLTQIKPHAEKIREKLEKVMPLFIIAGVVLSCMHQSSLGALMLIAPSKLSPLWFTPMLPLLFLASAVAVGFPMVLFESILVAKALKRKPETALLSSLARYIPILLGIYAVLKFGDLLIRHPFSSTSWLTVDGVSFLIELLVGIAIPLLLFLYPKTYKSITAMFIGSCMIIFGVVLNRINVFLVGFHPPFADTAYFPAVGEIAITAGLIAAIVFFYRVFICLFPVLPADEAPQQPSATLHGTTLHNTGKTALGALLLCAITSLAALSAHAQATEMPSLLLLDRSAANHHTDRYGTVRFMHKKHAQILFNDCSQCHHRQPTGEDDTQGFKTTRQTFQKLQPVACKTCHDLPLRQEAIPRPGLKGAFHQNCIDCHAERQAGPTSCQSCHQRKVPDHAELIKDKGSMAPQDITTQCLACHPHAGEDILHTAHWTWTGLSQDTLGKQNRADLGKANIINNYCVHVYTNWERCSMCHIGYGWKDKTFDFHDPTNIDCLICHDTTGQYKKSKTNAGYPVEGVDLIKIARNVGHPNRANCGACHFFGGGGDGVKHGDMDSSLLHPSPELDVHMGKHDFLCQDCHITRDHKIEGACFAIPAHEGRISCVNCHTNAPHHDNPLLSHHLNNHGKAIACQTCHIPQYARGNPTKQQWDWSQAGRQRPEKQDKYGKPTFHKKKGAFVWGKNLTPSYAWYNGSHHRYILGDKINKEGITHLNRPAGNINDPQSKITPFKIHSATQISD
ncbi:Ni/Fe-hydrogenase cytochrome b subunit, partial [bacterium]|nr:Ni/Fe-hydrogenase cytochrome b subunit [bacterium]